MPTIDRIQGYADDLTAIRRDLHAHPEIGFEETRTSGIVAEKLSQWGIEVHRGLGGTGVIGVLKGKGDRDRKSTRLNSSHPSISYAVFCLKKKKHDHSTVPHPSYHRC